MREIAGELRGWIAEGRRFAVASVVSTGGSAPRPVGAALAVSAEGTVIGSVSGGCVEGAVYELCLRAIEQLRPMRETYGYSDDDAYAVGLTCGGTIEVLVWPFIPAREGSPAAEELALLDEHLESILRGEPTALARTFGPPRPDVVGLDTVGLDTVGPSGVGLDVVGVWGDRVRGAVVGDWLAVEVRAMLAAGFTGMREICRDDRRVEVFVESHTPPPRMIVFGAIDFAAALTRVGRFLGYHVTVCDARPVFATRGRFPDAHEVVVDWPHRYLEHTSVDSRTVLAVLTHDAKFDVPVLEVALRLDVAYVGAMGSRRTHDDRMRRLREAGLADRELARLRSPIGLDLGARTPEETALSIAAEFVALQRGGTALPLSATSGSIHRAA